ncbi:GNAT family N-acetyltransferase [Streptomyces sp. NPDC051776]|uniref:GNAT family N-acetyltransferase n=1 Tax=Streptomyces sp. NPDC051776 TaxID=3155414 RepID=UPI00341BD5D8
MSLRITPLTDPERTSSARRLVWLASDAEGVPVGSAFLRLFTRPGQNHLAELDVRVHPAERGRGAGALLLDAAVTAARDDGRRSVVAQAEQGSPGDRFLAAHGFRAVMALTIARLPLTAVDPAVITAIAGEDRPGYRLVSWHGTVPDHLAKTFAASRRAMDDMPMGETDYGTVTWDVDRVRAVAEAVARRGDLLHTVAAVVDASGSGGEESGAGESGEGGGSGDGHGSIAGFTELVVPGDGGGDGLHYGTGVLPEHRGRGLGRWMKAASIRDARARHPGLAGLVTDTADDNLPMRAINEALGYVPTHHTVEYQRDLTRP